jgi:hypothetical protein
VEGLKRIIFGQDARIIALEGGAVVTGSGAVMSREAAEAVGAVVVEAPKGNFVDAIGQWPGDESDEEIADALAHDGPGITLDDLREHLLSEANEDTGAVRECLEWSDENEQGHVEVVNTVTNLCSKVRHQAERLNELEAAALDRAGVVTNPVIVARQAKVTKIPRRDYVADPSAHPFVAINGPWVITRMNTRPTLQRVFLDQPASGLEWVRHASNAWEFTDYAEAERKKPRGARIVAVTDLPALLAEDAAKAAAKASPSPSTVEVLDAG